jgi:hypothetical protein
MTPQDSKNFDKAIAAEEWFREFANSYGILSKDKIRLETLVKLLDEKLQPRLNSARPFLEEQYPAANAWLDQILYVGGRINGPPQEKEGLTKLLLDKVLATDATLKLRDNDGTQQSIAVDVTIDPAQEGKKLSTIRGLRDGRDPPGFNRNQQLPQALKTLGIIKHLVVILNPDNPPSKEALLTQIYAFANSGTRTRSIDVWRPHPSQEVAASAAQLWNQYSQNGRLTDLSKIIRKAKINGQSPETIARMLEHHPNYMALAQRTGKDPAQQYNTALVQRELEQHHQQALEVAGIVRGILKLPTPKIQRQPGGSAVLQGNSFNYRQQGDMVSLIAQDGRGEILRVRGEQVEVDRLTEPDVGQCRKVQEQLAVFQRESQPKEGQQRRKHGPRQ